MGKCPEKVNPERWYRY